MRLELTTFSLEGCNDSILTNDGTSTYEQSLEHLASHLVFLLKTDTELRDVLEAWATLSEPVKAGVLALVHTADKGDTTDTIR